MDLVFSGYAPGWGNKSPLINARVETAAVGSMSFERDDEAEGFLIVTSAADKGLVDIHARCPLVLTPEAAWE